jgi:hypothetical protein
MEGTPGTPGVPWFIAKESGMPGSLPDVYWYYVVMDYQTNLVLYSGYSLIRAAQALEPGSVYGAHDDPDTARAFAEMYADKARRAVLGRRHTPPTAVA